MGASERAILDHLVRCHRSINPKDTEKRKHNMHEPLDPLQLIDIYFKIIDNRSQFTMDAETVFIME